MGKTKSFSRFGEIEHLLFAVAQPQAQQTARPHGQQGLHRLVAIPLALAPRVQPQVDTGIHIGRGQHDKGQQGTYRSTAADKPPDIDAAANSTAAAPTMTRMVPDMCRSSSTSSSTVPSTAM